MTTSEERAVRNEAMFREANEKLREVREKLAEDDERTPFLCECEDVACTAMLLMTVAEYERGRDSGECFLVSTEHENRTRGDVLARNSRYLLVRKGGYAGELARELDPRR